MYVSEIRAEGIFATFHWWLKNVKSRPKIALFSNEYYFEIDFKKEKKTMFFWSKVSKLHKKDPTLHVRTTFSLKQKETRTSSGPIPHPLRQLYLMDSVQNISSCIISCYLYSLLILWIICHMLWPFFPKAAKPKGGLVFVAFFLQRHLFDCVGMILWNYSVQEPNVNPWEDSNKANFCFSFTASRKANAL